MAVHVHRVIVRGRFRDLDEASIAGLRAVADEHEPMVAAHFTPTGTVTYDRAIQFFTFRYEIRTDDDVEGRQPSDAGAIAEALAAADLAANGLTHGPLKSFPSDMGEMWADD